jgi:hypothetical protein
MTTFLELKNRLFLIQDDFVKPINNQQINLMRNLLLLSLLYPYQIIIAQDTYYPPKLFVEISSNIQVGVKREGVTKTYVNYRIENNNILASSQSSSYTDSYIKDVTKERIKKTNEDYYKSRPKASSLFGGIARAFAGDYSGLLDFGGNVVDHMMTPKYRVYETSTYKTTEKFVKTNSGSNENSSTIKNNLIQELTQEYTVDANAGFIRFSIRIYNNSSKGVRIKSPEFGLYFLMPNNTREFIKFPEATAGNSNIHWMPSMGFKDFEINVEGLSVKELFENYLNSEEIELNLNNLEVVVNGINYYAGEIEERYENEGIRVKYYNGIETKEFFALINDSRPTIEELIKEYLNEVYLELYPNPEGGSVVEAIKRISVNENKYSDKKLNEINGNELIEWRKWLITVYDQNNMIIPFKISDRLNPGYKVSLSFFSAKDLLGEYYRPVIFTKNGINLTADGSFKLNINLKKGDELIIENVKLNKLYTDKIDYNITHVNSAPLSGLIQKQTEAQLFLKQQEYFESMHHASQYVSMYNFNNASNQNLKLYWFKPTRVHKVEHFTAEDFFCIKWIKGNSELDIILNQLSSVTQNAIMEAFIIKHLYNAFDPTIKVAENIDYGLVQGNSSLTFYGNNNSPINDIIFKYLTSENGMEAMSDTISKIKELNYIVPKNIDASKNVWKSSISENQYYSFFSVSNNTLPSNGSYLSLSTGKYALRFNVFIDTRSENMNPVLNPMINNEFSSMMDGNMGMGGYLGLVQNKNKTFSVESLVRYNELQPIIFPIHYNPTGLEFQEIILSGNKELFDITFDVKVIRKQ